MGKRVDKKAMSLGALYQEKWGGGGQGIRRNLQKKMKKQPIR